MSIKVKNVQIFIINKKSNRFQTRREIFRVKKLKLIKWYQEKTIKGIWCKEILTDKIGVQI